MVTVALRASVLPAARLPLCTKEPSSVAPVTAAAPDDARHDLLVREADAMTLEYEAALRQFEGAAMPAALRPALATLDRSALEIRGALADDPDAVFLLEQLRRTYARRVTLTQRAVTG